MHIDWVTVGLVMAILLLGLVMVTSASISIASKETGDVFFYLERQLILSIIGCRRRRSCSACRRSCSIAFRCRC